MTSQLFPGFKNKINLISRYDAILGTFFLANCSSRQQWDDVCSLLLCVLKKYPSFSGVFLLVFFLCAVDFECPVRAERRRSARVRACTSATFVPNFATGSELDRARKSGSA